ncbi:short chain dehydrogenase [Pyxidicoccus fallax]|uniref:Short chain dehydrogenase n=1 Tax=Pyxidicoccus fallax TaxID=394095 RepID=A0A848LKD5_9BACT|nr:short chain dehydrogenase [Pyxidicoccus fallax]NMO18124.1 short chain dehydrogenase [Pyxidicoccus fallax]NPC79418.1 short chain dehydrogenase [Pyxidicoccus fallax]
MKVVVIGATGTIGRAVVRALSGRHEIVEVGRSSGAYQADITSKDSLQRLFQAVAPFDAVVSVTGTGAFKGLTELTDEDFQFSLSNKLMGQINVARLALPHVRDKGSITLTSGVLAQEPMKGSAAISLINAGLEGFTRAAALEAPRSIRINVVSPPWVQETLDAMGMKGVPGMPAEKVAPAYVESVEGTRTGEVIDARRFG